MWKVCDQPWTQKYDTLALCSCFERLTLSLPAAPRFLIAAVIVIIMSSPACHLWTIVCLIRWRSFSLFFLRSPPLPGFISDITKETSAIRSHIGIISPRYWIRTNTGVSLIRFGQMSCFMRHWIPSVTWNNLILPPWITALRWLIFADWLSRMSLCHGAVQPNAKPSRLQIPRLLTNQTFSHVHPLACSETHLLHLCEKIMDFFFQPHSLAVCYGFALFHCCSQPKKCLSFVLCVELRYVWCVFGKWRAWYWHGIQSSLNQYCNVPSEDGVRYACKKLLC